MDKIVGYIERITFQNEENGWTVARLKEKGKRDLTVIVGNMPSIQEGETISCEGFWKNDTNYGHQFQVQNYQVTQPSSINGIKKYLSSGLIKGIGNVFAERIVSYHGKKTLDVIDKTPDELLKIDGIGEKRISKIKECWDEQKAVREVMVYLQTQGISPIYAQKIFKQYGDDSVWKIQDNPYHLARDIHGIGFKTADKIAGKLGISKNSEKRIDAGIEYALSELSNNGHTCYPVEDFLKAAEKLLDVSADEIRERLQTISLEYRIVLADLEVNNEHIPYLWLTPFWVSEQGIAKELKRIHYGYANIKSFDTPKAIAYAQKLLAIELAKNQVKAVEQSIVAKTHIITGGPGTGKSTITKVILAILKKKTDKILLAAPTGRAAKRLAAITGEEAKTIHALLEFDFSINGFKRNREHPLECDLLIVDEASMIDSVLMYSLLKAIPFHAKVIFIGDIDQLPSVGAGNVLRDLIASEQIPTTRLTEVFRQAASSKIIMNAHRINKGEFPDIRIDKTADFFFIKEEDNTKIAETIKGLVATRLPKRYGYDNFEDIQVLSPMKRGVIGTNNLNTVLQNTLNPSKDPLSKFGRIFHKHDKVMQIRNNYDKEVFNGDVGRITRIDRIDQEVFVKYDNDIVQYDFTELDQIQLAYAVSVHKYQGSECPCIVMPIHTSHYTLLFRNLLYTGITRGKKMVILVGTTKALSIAIRNNQVTTRQTGLQQAMQDVFGKINPKEEGSSLYSKEIIKLEFL